MGATKIEWANYTFNPWKGCQKCSLGCKNCYASALAKRFGEDFAGSRIKTSEANWKLPLKWNNMAKIALERYEWRVDNDNCEKPIIKPPRPRVFCASLADVFEPWEGPIVDHKGREIQHGWQHLTQEKYVTGTIDGEPVTMDDLRRDLFRMDTPNLDKLYLTKRPENIIPMIERTVGLQWWKENRSDSAWLGTSVENQETADKRIQELIECRDLAARLFLSVEPLLGPFEFDRTAFGIPSAIDWIIVGGESGPNARPCNVEWIRSIVRQCKEASVPCFVKQLGANVVVSAGTRYFLDSVGPVENLTAGRMNLKDKKGGNTDEWPIDLRVRQMPETTKT